MIRLSRFADAQLGSLTTYDEAKDRPEAARNLRASVVRAGQRISSNQGPIFGAPRPYPTLAKLGWRGIKERSYWIAFADNGPDIEITPIFHESANIPARLP